MAPAPVAVSLMGGFISAIAILGNATETYYFGTQLCTILFGYTLAMLFIVKVVLPILYNLRITSINEYLELRYKSAALRKLITLFGMVALALYMGMCLYAPSLALATVTSLSTLNSMIIMGFICTFYTTIGGVKAVVYTDVLQTLLILAGTVAVIVLCCYDLGGVARVWNIADRGQRIQFFNLDPSLFVRHTFWSTFVLGFFNFLYVGGLGQAAFQRFASVSSLSIAVRVGWVFLAGTWLLYIIFFFSGLVAYAAYSECDPMEAGLTTKADQIIPFLVMDRLGHLSGLTGLFVAAVYGGVLSSLSSTGNGIACQLWEDFLKPLPYFTALSDTRATQVIKFLSLVVGVAAVCLGVLIRNLGNVFVVLNLLTSSISGPFTGIILSGVLLPWVNSKGAAVGYMGSLVLSTWWNVGKFVRGAGLPTMLPLSTSGCNNATFFIATTTNNSISTIVIANSTSIGNEYSLESPLTEDLLMSTDNNESWGESTSLYEISYCYVGITGTVLAMIISGVVSPFTGPTHPKEVCETVVFPPVARAYRRAWGLPPVIQS